MTLRMLLKSVLEARGPRGSYRALRSQVPIYPPCGGPRARESLSTSPILAMRARWAGTCMRDCRTHTACRSIAHVLIPVNPNNKDPFFATASRTLLTAVLRSFVASKVDWSFRDALHAMLDMDVLRTILEKTAEGRRVVKLYFGARHTLFNIMSTVANDLDPYLEVAAAWDAAKGKIAIRDWVKGAEDRILVLGHDDENEPTSKCVNQLSSSG